MLCASLYSDRAAWHRNANGAGSAWTMTVVSDTPGLGRSIAAVDLDGTGTLDVVAGGQPLAVWASNVDGAGTLSVAQTVAEGDGAWFLAPADLDGDGRIDLLVGSAHDWIAWYRNELCPPSRRRRSCASAPRRTPPRSCPA